MLPVLVIVLWQVLSAAGALDDFVFPAPSEIGRTFVANIANGVLLTDLWASAARILPGFAIGCVVGLVLGILMAWFRVVETAFHPTISALYALPKIAMLPMFALWFGIGEASKIYLIAFSCFFYMNISTLAGAKNIDRNLITLARSLEMTHLQLFRKVLLPGSVPSIMAGVRLAFGNALVVVVAAEMISADSGIGFRIQGAASLLDIPLLYAALLLFGILGATSNLLFLRLERAVSPWRQPAAG